MAIPIMVAIDTSESISVEEMERFKRTIYFVADMHARVYVIKFKTSKVTRWVNRLLDAGFTESELASYLMVSVPTVTSWKQNMHLPHRLAVKGIVRSLRKLYKEQVRR